MLLTYTDQQRRRELIAVDEIEDLNTLRRSWRLCRAGICCQHQQRRKTTGSS